jgi:hypothetical protein
MKRQSWILLTMALGVGIAWPLMSQKQEAAKEVKRRMFLPPPLADDWSKWIVGEWEGAGESPAGKGRGTARFELALNGQFLISRGESEITEISSDQRQYLKKQMHAADEEIDRFKSQPYKSLEIYTIDQETGEVVGYLFDSLRCIATGRGNRQGNKETMKWEWAMGHRGTRITEKVDENRLLVIEKTHMPDGSVMEDKGEMTRTNQK